jgi:elongation factor Ts
MAIEAKLVQELRSRTGAALMDCKKALQEAGGDLERAVDHLRKAGLKGAEKRAGRETAEGRVRVWVAPHGKIGAMVCLTSETDFVARTDEFASLASELAEHVARVNPDTAESLLDNPFRGRGTSVGEALKALSGKLGENMRVTQIQRFESPTGRVGGYVHHDGKTGALISIKSERPAAEVDAFLKTLGMHIAAMRPLALARERIPAELVERERAIYLESEDVLQKPADKREMIVKGKLERFFKDAALLDQPWVLDPKLSVAKATEAALGQGASIEAYALFRLG